MREDERKALDRHGFAVGMKREWHRDSPDMNRAKFARMLFDQLEGLGVSCASCRQRELYGECQMDLVEDHFLCNEWSSDPKDVTSAPPEERT